jgi:hypothetical protein
MVLPEIRLLQATIALAEELNFSRAPERLRIEQSTLSKRIVELESQIDLRLFERNHQVVELTESLAIFPLVSAVEFRLSGQRYRFRREIVRLGTRIGWRNPTARLSEAKQNRRFSCSDSTDCTIIKPDSTH